MTLAQFLDLQRSPDAIVLPQREANAAPRFIPLAPSGFEPDAVAADAADDEVERLLEELLLFGAGGRKR